MGSGQTQSQSGGIETRLVALLAMGAGVALHVVFCAESPLFDERLSHDLRGWITTVGFASVGIAVSLGLGLSLKLLRRYRGRWLIPLIIGLYCGAALRVVERIWSPLDRLTEYTERAAKQQYGEGRVELRIVHTSPAGRYRVSFPSRPTTVTKTLSTDLGEVPFVMTGVQEGSHSFQVVYKDFTLDMMPFGAGAFIDATKFEVASRVGGTVSNERELEFDSHPSRQFRVERVLEGRHIVMEIWMILVDTRLYQLMVVSEGLQLDSRANAFFDSFALTE